MRKHPTALALACATILAAPAAASAHNHHIGARLTFSQPRHHRHRRATTALASASLAVGVGNLHGDCGTPPIPASFIRVIVSWDRPVSDALPCAVQAHAAGLRVLLVIQWDNSLSTGQIVQRFQSALAVYREVAPFAVAVGNEQEGPWDGGQSEYPGQYAAIWRMVEPMIAQGFPHAIRVAGEISPWGDAFMSAAAQVGLPGAQAYAYHAYPANAAGAAQQFAMIAREHGVRAWADEGLCGPGSWAQFGCTDASTLKGDGFSLAAEWYDGPGAVSTSGPDSPVY